MLEETVQPVLSPSWVIVPMTYEKWVHPGTKEKHYRAVFRSITGRRVSTKKFKTASKALEYAARFNLFVCGRRELINAIRGQGNTGA